MFVQLFCKDRNQKEKDELYQVLGAIAHRENVQIEERGDVVEIDVCPQGKIIVHEEDREVILSANTRHAGAGFHAFCVDIFMDIQQELNGEFELVDDLEFDQDGNFHRLHHLYEDELDYLRGNLVKREPVFYKNYLYDETYFLPMEKENAIATPIGYIDTKEFLHMNPHDLMDLFYVWNEWDMDASYYKNAALTLLAKEGYGPYALMNDHTHKMANMICDYIELAYKMDSSIPLPVKEYRFYIQLLQREDQLKDPVNMEQEVYQYRLMEVYHLFENVKVVALGSCERSYDPVTQSLCLMSARKEEHEWDYLIQVSKQPLICSQLDQLEKKEPIQYRDKAVWIHEYKEDGIFFLEAKIVSMEEELFFHCTLKEEKQIPYLKQCIKESEFAILD